MDSKIAFWLMEVKEEDKVNEWDNAKNATKVEMSCVDLKILSSK